MSSRTSSRSTFTITPSTMSPALKYLIVSSIAARKASSEPMSLTATCGVVRVASVLLVMWARAPVRTLSRRYCYAEDPYRTAEAGQPVRRDLSGSFRETENASTTEGTYNRCERSEEHTSELQSH